MAKNLKYQFLYAIEQNFKAGMSKHSAKKQGKTESNLIFSYSDRKNLIDFSSNFANYMKENYSNIRQVKDITTEHYQEFLNFKAIKCSTKTLETYTSNINKVTKVTNKAYHLRKNHNIKTPLGFITSKRNLMMTDEHINIMLNNCEIGSTTYNSLMICKSFGLRVSELSKLHGTDIIEKDDNIYLRIIDSKGKRSRLSPCVDRNNLYLLMLKDKYKYNRIIPIQHESINQNIRRLMKKTGISNIYKTTSIHAIRKNYAQKTFDNARISMSKQNSLDYVSNALGHNNNRFDITKAYLTNVY